MFLPFVCTLAVGLLSVAAVAAQERIDTADTPTPFGGREVYTYYRKSGTETEIRHGEFWSRKVSRFLVTETRGRYENGKRTGDWQFVSTFADTSLPGLREKTTGRFVDGELSGLWTSSDSLEPAGETWNLSVEFDRGLPSGMLHVSGVRPFAESSAFDVRGRFDGHSKMDGIWEIRLEVGAARLHSILRFRNGHLLGDTIHDLTTGRIAAIDAGLGHEDAPTGDSSEMVRLGYTMTGLGVLEHQRGNSVGNNCRRDTLRYMRAARARILSEVAGRSHFLQQAGVYDSPIAASRRVSQSFRVWTPPLESESIRQAGLALLDRAGAIPIDLDSPMQGEADRFERVDISFDPDSSFVRLTSYGHHRTSIFHGSIARTSSTRDSIAILIDVGMNDRGVAPRGGDATTASQSVQRALLVGMWKSGGANPKAFVEGHLIALDETEWGWPVRYDRPSPVVLGPAVDERR